MPLYQIVIDNLTRALAVAVSPMPIVAIFLILVNKRSRANSIAFLLGWIIAIILNVTVFAFLYGPRSINSHNHLFALRIIEGILGVGLLCFAYLHWRLRPKPGVEPVTPKWMKSIETLTPLKSFLIAFLIITINSKNTFLNIATGVNIAQSTSSFFEAVFTILIYTFVASLTITLPVATYFLMGHRLEELFDKTRKWLIRNGSIMLSIIFLILGFHLLMKFMGY